MRFCIYQHQVVPDDVLFDAALIDHGIPAALGQAYQAAALCQPHPGHGVRFEQTIEAGSTVWLCVVTDPSGAQRHYAAEDVRRGDANTHLQILYAVPAFLAPQPED